ncbi:hypothetical protein [Lysinibacillus piscis]|uniref:Uncharacterized protein n=1 Tax=Lysinibacillus piscis TaxID=2518931 RepID=A0ABQ5NJM7_9BACI|nr:hypothetical protein [Lysinibacillus sp. KH24]GLC88570.1 hypothetical protein LYSBPC_16970 [Lysinibacillus sp. KH24]
MEQLIIFIIIAIASSIFGKVKQKSPQKAMPPFKMDAQVEVSDTTDKKIDSQRGFKEFAQTYLQEKSQGTIETANVQSVVETAPKPSRQRVIQQSEVTNTKDQATFAMPNSKKSLMQAVVMAEILGPPKAKRR